MIEIIGELFHRDLKKLEEEIRLVPEAALWKTAGEIKNSCGNICLHLCGNVQHFIGAELGKTGYVRNRDAEFATKNLSKEKLLEEIAAAKAAVTKGMASITQADLNTVFPQDFLGKEVTTEYMLIHLLAHFNYHLGQINYLRRIV
jgi:uncharacterized damage-inducible protein DinB